MFLPLSFLSIWVQVLDRVQHCSQLLLISIDSFIKEGDGKAVFSPFLLWKETSQYWISVSITIIIIIIVVLIIIIIVMIYIFSTLCIKFELIFRFLKLLQNLTKYTYSTGYFVKNC